MPEKSCSCFTFSSWKIRRAITVTPCAYAGPLLWRRVPTRGHYCDAGCLRRAITVTPCAYAGPLLWRRVPTQGHCYEGHLYAWTLLRNTSCRSGSIMQQRAFRGYKGRVKLWGNHFKAILNHLLFSTELSKSIMWLCKHVSKKCRNWNIPRSSKWTRKRFRSFEL